MFGVDDGIPDHLEAHEGVGLVLSNLLFAPLVMAAIVKRAPRLGALALVMAANSILFHMCGAGWVCVERLEVLRVADHILAWWLTASISHWLLAYNSPRLKGRFGLVGELLHTTTMVVIILRMLVSLQSTATLAWVMGFIVFDALVKIVLVDRGVWFGDYDPALSYVGLAFGLTGIFVFYFVDVRYYWLSHSLWHASIALSGTAYLYARRLAVWP